jgi:hypothetical protein
MAARAKKQKNSAGRPAFEPTQKQRREVQKMVGLGCPQKFIAWKIGISIPTLEKYFREDIDAGACVANYKVSGNLFRIATGNSKQAASAAMFWMKTRAGWKETNIQENKFSLDEDDPKDLLYNILSKMGV